MEDILKIEHVTKRYRDVVAVDDLSLNIPKGIIFGLLGPNGAGKTSLIRMITQITGVDSGQIYFDGQLLQPDNTNDIGYMPEERGLYKKMKIGDQLMYLARLKNMSKEAAKKQIYYWLNRFGIESWWNKQVEDLSKGMQQKIQFISTVMHQPELLILDEPFSGLDPINANLIRDEIYRLVNEQSVSVIFSTHRMEQVEEICQQIALIDHGRCILQGEVSELKNQFKKNIFELQTTKVLPMDALSDYQIESVAPYQYRIHFNEDQSSNTFLKTLLEQGIEVRQYIEELPSMNEIFIEQVNEYEKS